VSEVREPVIRDSREYFPGMISASVIDRYYQVDEVGHSFDGSLDM
jgi:hypothetical protein